MFAICKDKEGHPMKGYGKLPLSFCSLPSSKTLRLSTDRIYKSLP
jgi:hypothetical protein